MPALPGAVPHHGAGQPPLQAVPAKGGGHEPSDAELSPIACPVMLMGKDGAGAKSRSRNARVGGPFSNVDQLPTRLLKADHCVRDEPLLFGVKIAVLINRN